MLLMCGVMNTQPPSIGQIVLYRPDTGSLDREARPAIILGIRKDAGSKQKDRVQLQVFTPIGDVYLDAIWSEDGAKGSWFRLPEVDHRPIKIDKSENSVGGTENETNSSTATDSVMASESE